MDSKGIGQLFDRISGTYDRFNHLLSLNIDKSWRRKTVARLAPADEVLDVAIGTADLSIEFLKQGKASHITGLDLSQGMMKIGRAKVEAAGYGSAVDFQEGSALQMPYPPESFDTVACAFGVRNFSDPDRGLSEMCRVLKTGGRLAILEFSYPENPLLKFLYNFFFSWIMPAVGKSVSKDPQAYLYFRESVKNFTWGEKMVQRIRNAGFSDVSYKTFSCGICTLYLASKAESSQQN